MNVSIMLQCTGRSDPAPTLQWYFPAVIHDEVVVEPSLNRTDLTTTSYYRLKGIRADQSGLYRCEAQNLVSTAEAHIEVIVNENMTIPTASPYTPAARATTGTAVIVLVCILGLMLLVILLTLLYRKVNREHHYDVAEAEKLNEGDGSEKQHNSAALLHVNSDGRHQAQTEL